MRNIINVTVKLLVICIVAAIALGFTNMYTEKAIAQQQAKDEIAAMQKVVADADDFRSVENPLAMEGNYSSVKSLLKATANGTLSGYIVKMTINGYGGPIDVIVGIDADLKTIRGISVGGSDFKETAGLGSKTKDPAFTSQFDGKQVPLELVKNNNATGNQINAISGATISSNAVMKAANTAVEYVQAQKNKLSYNESGEGAVQ